MEKDGLKKKALVTGGTKKDVPAIAVLIMNIKETNLGLVDEVVVFHDGISNRDQRLINSIYPTRFLKYSFPGDTANFNETITKYFSTMIFCKFECFRLLSEYSKVVWTDYDVVIKDNISELMESTVSGLRMIQSGTLRSQFYDTIDEIDVGEFEMGGEAYCCSLFVLEDIIENYNDLYNWCIKQTPKYGKHLFGPEQGVITMCLQHFNISPSAAIQESIYGAHPVHDSMDKVTNAKILHAYGQPKFWNGIKNENWNSRYKKWLKLGGSKVKNKNKILIYINKLVNKVRKVTLN